MKKVLLLLWVGLAIISCQREESEPKPKELPAGTTLRLSISGGIDEGKTDNEDNPRALDFYVDANSKVRATLKGKTSVKVMTYLYSNGTQVFAELRDWSVTNNGTALRFEGDIVTSAPLPLGTARLVAILASEGSPITEPTINRQSSVVPLTISDGTNKTSIDVPYAMETTMTITADRGTNIGSGPSNQLFKPYGYLLHVTLENTTNDNVTINNLAAFDYDTPYTLDPEHLDQGTKMRRSSVSRYMRIQALSQNITIPARQTSDRHLILWLGTLSTTAMTPILALEGTGATTSPGYYGTYAPTKASYEAGKVYNAKIKIREVKNPLSYFANGLVDRMGRSITNSDLRLADFNSRIGRFSRKQVLGQADREAAISPYYPAGAVYTPIAGYRLPTHDEFALIFPKQTVNTDMYHPGIGAEGTFSYAEMDRHSSLSTDGAWAFRKSNFWEVLRPNYPAPINSFPNPEDEAALTRNWTSYALGHIHKSWTSPVTKNYDRCYAFRYEWKARPDFKLTIYCKFVGATVSSVYDVKDKPASWWNDAEKRVLPSRMAKWTDGVQYPSQIDWKPFIEYLYFDYKGGRPVSLWTILNPNEPIVLNSYGYSHNLWDMGGGEGYQYTRIKGPTRFDIETIYTPSLASLWLYKIDN